MILHIPEIELNFSNACTGNCFICAKAHGRKNVSFMPDYVFQRTVEQLLQIDTEIIQTSGNGDCWLHPQFLQYLRTLRRTFPYAKIVNYSNFACYYPDRTDIILEEELLDELWTRIDSLDAETFERSTGLNQKVVFANLDYFIRRNGTVELHVGYSSIPQYYRKCRAVLGKRPFHGPFSEEEAGALPDEYDAVVKRFRHPRSETRLVQFYRINQSLWAEREDPACRPDDGSMCPKYTGGILERVCWICPNGDVNVCGYDDTQGIFTAGNVLQEHIRDIWNGKRRRKLLHGISERKHRGYPCHPRCCRMYGDDDV